MDGHTGDGEVLGRFCGTDQPSTTVSSANEMTVRMRTDAYAAGYGFKARYSIGWFSYLDFLRYKLCTCVAYSWLELNIWF